MENEKKDSTLLSNHYNFKNVLIMWGLVWLGLFTGGFLSIVAVIWAYVARDNHNDWKENTHFNYFIKAFWWSIFWFVLGVLTLIIFIGFVILFILTIWYIIIAVKGTIAALDNKAIS